MVRYVCLDDGLCGYVFKTWLFGSNRPGYLYIWMNGYGERIGIRIDDMHPCIASCISVVFWFVKIKATRLKSDR